MFELLRCSGSCFLSVVSCLSNVMYHCIQYRARSSQYGALWLPGCYSDFAALMLCPGLVHGFKVTDLRFI